MGKTPVIELKDIKKHFGSVKANDGVSLSVYKSEIHAILGENGSGKSTLMNILSGLYSPDAGEILLRGEETVFRSPGDAIEHGIGMIHQHFKLVEALPAWENIVGGMKQGFLLSKKKVLREIAALCEKYGFKVDLEKKVFQMPVGEKQTVEIVKALYRGAEILILDEPTAVLTSQETESLFSVLREMADKGCAVIIITHKLQEVMEVSRRVTILQHGRDISTGLTSEFTPQKLAELMVGRKIDTSIPHVDIPKEQKKPVLKIRDLTLPQTSTSSALSVRELEVDSYEILGIAGVSGSGQKELCDAITGMRRAKGSITLNGKEITGMSPGRMLKNQIRIGFIPEDRLGMGLASGMDISDNVALSSYYLGNGIFRNRAAERRAAEKLIKDYNVSTTGPGEMIQSLSGGNIQKVLLGREIERKSDLLIAAYPVRGLDIGATNFIFEKLNEEKKKGVAILLICEDLDMLLGICDRIAVLSGGKLMGTLDARSVTKQQLGLLMMGFEPEEKVC